MGNYDADRNVWGRLLSLVGALPMIRSESVKTRALTVNKVAEISGYESSADSAIRWANLRALENDAQARMRIKVSSHRLPLSTS